MAKEERLSVDELVNRYSSVKFSGGFPTAAQVKSFPDDPRRPTDIAATHPFLAWLATYHQWGMAVVGKQVTVSSRIASRFALRIENDGSAALGIQQADMDAFMRMQWERAEIERRVRHDNVLTLFTDAKKRISISIPISEAITEKFDDLDPPSLRIRLIRAKGATIAVWTGAPKLELPLAKKGFDQAEPEATA